MSAVYSIRNLVKIYPGQTQPANDCISLDIHQGEIFGLLGDNGAGKSTLVRQMVNLVRSTSGGIMLFGRPIAADALLVPMSVGYMPQDGLALNSLTVGEALYFTAHLRGTSRSQARAERDRLIALWELEAQRHRPIPRLSGGQRRLVQIAVAMAGAPPVLILDEPTANLDPGRRRQVWQILRRLNQEQGTTIIFITHDALEAEKIIQRVGIIRAGRLVALGRPAELKQQLDRKLRLDLHFSPAEPPGLPPGLMPHEIEAGRWQVLLEWDEIPSVVDCLRYGQIEDFRLTSATLEDLYLHYADQA